MGLGRRQRGDSEATSESEAHARTRREGREELSQRHSTPHKHTLALACAGARNRHVARGAWLSDSGWSGNAGIGLRLAVAELHHSMHHSTRERAKFGFGKLAMKFGLDVSKDEEAGR